MKKYILAFMILASIGAVSTVMLLTVSVPQNTDQLGELIEEYESIEKEDFKFVETKDVTIANIEKLYSITADDLSSYIISDSYVPGNRNPFTPSGDLNQPSDSNDSNNDSNSNDDTNNNDSNDSGNSSNGSTGTNTNPPATNK